MEGLVYTGVVLGAGVVVVVPLLTVPVDVPELSPRLYVGVDVVLGFV